MMDDRDILIAMRRVASLIMLATEGMDEQVEAVVREAAGVGTKTEGTAVVSPTRQGSEQSEDLRTTVSTSALTDGTVSISYMGVGPTTMVTKRDLVEKWGISMGSASNIVRDQGKVTDWVHGKRNIYAIDRNYLAYKCATSQECPDIMTAHSAAKYCGVSDSTMTTWLNQGNVTVGKLPSIVACGSKLVAKVDLDNYLRRRETMLSTGTASAMAAIMRSRVWNPEIVGSLPDGTMFTRREIATIMGVSYETTSRFLRGITSTCSSGSHGGKYTKEQVVEVINRINGLRLSATTRQSGGTSC